LWGIRGLARRKKSADAAGLVVLLLIVAAAVAALIGLAIVAPIALFIWWVFCETQRLIQPRAKPALTPNERDQLEELDNLLIEYQDSRASILKIGDESGIPRRGDNLFDGRYGPAREINSQFEQLNSDITKLNVAKSEIENRLSAKIDNWTAIRGRSTGARVGVALYLAIFSTIAEISPQWAFEIGKFTDVLGLKLTDLTATLFGGSAVASLVSGCALWLIDFRKR
jgi:hypothetical protein